MPHMTAHLRRCALCLLLVVLWAGWQRQGSGALRAEGDPSRAPAPVGLAAGGRGDEVVAGDPQSSQTTAPALTSAAQSVELPHVPGEGDDHQQVSDAIQRYESGGVGTKEVRQQAELIQIEEGDLSLIGEVPEHAFVTNLKSTDEGVIGLPQNSHTIKAILGIIRTHMLYTAPNGDKRYFSGLLTAETIPTLFKSQLGGNMAGTCKIWTDANEHPDFPHVVQGHGDKRGVYPPNWAGVDFWMLPLPENTIPSNITDSFTGVHGISVEIAGRLNQPAKVEIYENGILKRESTVGSISGGLSLGADRNRTYSIRIQPVDGYIDIHGPIFIEEGNMVVQFFRIKNSDFGIDPQTSSACPGAFTPLEVLFSNNSQIALDVTLEASVPLNAAAGFVESEGWSVAAGGKQAWRALTLRPASFLAASGLTGRDLTTLGLRLDADAPPGPITVALTAQAHTTGERIAAQSVITVQGGCATPSPTPTATPTLTATATPTATPSPSATPSPTPTRWRALLPLIHKSG